MKTIHIQMNNLIIKVLALLVGISMLIGCSTGTFVPVTGGESLPSDTPSSQGVETPTPTIEIISPLEPTNTEVPLLGDTAQPPAIIPEATLEPSATPLPVITDTPIATPISYTPTPILDTPIPILASETPSPQTVTEMPTPEATYTITLTPTSLTLPSPTYTETPTGEEWKVEINVPIPASQVSDMGGVTAVKTLLENEVQDVIQDPGVSTDVKPNPVSGGDVNFTVALEGEGGVDQFTQAVFVDLADTVNLLGGPISMAIIVDVTAGQNVKLVLETNLSTGFQ